MNYPHCPVPLPWLFPRVAHVSHAHGLTIRAFMYFAYWITDVAHIHRSSVIIPLPLF
jgi:hypothetical protein